MKKLFLLLILSLFSIQGYAGSCPDGSEPVKSVSASMELDILGGVDRSEIYHLNGQINEKIWGASPREDFFRVYMLLAKE